MGFELASPAAIVCLDNFWAIEGDALEGVDSDEDDTGVGVDTVLCVTIADGMKDCGVALTTCI